MGGQLRCTSSNMCTVIRATAAPAMIDLAKTYEQKGMYLASGEMPDHLPTVLEFASTQSTEVAREFLAEMTHILQAIFSALAKRQSLRVGSGGTDRTVGRACRTRRRQPTLHSMKPGKSLSLSAVAAPADSPVRAHHNRCNSSKLPSIVNTFFGVSARTTSTPCSLATTLHLPGGVFIGSLIRFDRDQYTWKSDSSQLLRCRAAPARQQSVSRWCAVPLLWPLLWHADAACSV